MPKYLQACKLEYTKASKVDLGKAIDPNCVYLFWKISNATGFEGLILTPQRTSNMLPILAMAFIILGHN